MLEKFIVVFRGEMMKGGKKEMKRLIAMLTLVIVLFLVATPACEKLKIPSNEIQYTIINEEKYLDIKTSIDVRLKSEVDEQTITQIAKELEKERRGKYKRIFINYYLEGMKVGEGAYALSHFNPNLEVQILGFTKEEKTQLLEKTSLSESNLIGRWIDDTPYLGRVITISKNANTSELSIQSLYKDGSEGSKKLIEKIVNGQKHWVEEGNVFGEYYFLNNDGNLSIYDAEGLYKTFPKIK